MISPNNTHDKSSHIHCAADFVKLSELISQSSIIQATDEEDKELPPQVGKLCLQDHPHVQLNICKALG